DRQGGRPPLGKGCQPQHERRVAPVPRRGRPAATNRQLDVLAGAVLDRAAEQPERIRGEVGGLLTAPLRRGSRTVCCFGSSSISSRPPTRICWRTRPSAKRS